MHAGLHNDRALLVARKQLLSKPQNGMVRPCSCTAGNRSWARVAEDKDHDMSYLNRAIAVVGIDFGKNSFYAV